MVHRRICLLALILSVLFAPLTAQILQPVRWTAETVGDSLRFTAAIDSGWHMTLISVSPASSDGDTGLYALQGSEHTAALALSLPLSAAPVTLRYNACDDSQCTAPETFTYPDTGTDAPLASASADPSPATASSLLYLFILGFLGGLLAIFTPCVWPVIPMTVSFFLKQGGGRRAALFYGLSIIIIYLTLGLLVTALFGASALNALSTNALLNLFFFALLVIFALSFFGLFDITLPSSWSTRLDSQARSATGFLSILLMAFTLVIVSFSCTGPIIGTLLVQAAGNSMLAPAVGMFGFALALALPFSFFALFPHVMQRVPRSGSWMNTFKVTLAFIELALSLKFLSVADMAYGWGILPRWLFIALWAACFAALTIYLLHGIRPLSAARRTVRLSLALVSALFTAYLVSGLFGAPVRLISPFAPPTDISNRHSFCDYRQGLAYAARHGRPVILQFSGYGCVNCRKMEAYVLSDDSVKAALADYVLITLYVDSRQDENRNGVQDGVEYSELQRDLFHANSQPFFVRLTPPEAAFSSSGFPFSDPLSDSSSDPLSGYTPSAPFFFSTSPAGFLRWLNNTAASDHIYIQ